MQLCSNPRGSCGIEPKTFGSRGQLLSCPLTIGPLLCCKEKATEALHPHQGHKRWHMACGPGSPDLSKSDSDMASKSFTFTFTLKKYQQITHERPLLQKKYAQI